MVEIAIAIPFICVSFQQKSSCMRNENVNKVDSNANIYAMQQTKCLLHFFFISQLASFWTLVVCVIFSSSLHWGCGFNEIPKRQQSSRYQLYLICFCCWLVQSVCDEPTKTRNLLHVSLFVVVVGKLSAPFHV